MNLKDDWHEAGRDYSKFKRVINEVSASTHMVKINNSTDVILMSYKGTTNKDGDIFYRLDKDTVEILHSDPTRWSLARILPGNPMRKNSIMTEMKDTTKLLLCYDNRMYILSKDAIYSLGDRAGASGERLKRDSVIRDLYIADGLVNPDKLTEINMLVRQQKYTDCIVRKAFACLGSKSVFEPLSSILKITDDIMAKHPLGEGTVNSWAIDHRKCMIHIEFPEYDSKIHRMPDKYVPGVMIITSDVGRSAYRVLMTLRIDGEDSSVFLDEEHWDHSSSFTDVKTKMHDYIFDVIPAELKNVMEILSKTQGMTVGSIKSAYKIVAQELRLVSAIGQKRTNSLIAQLNGEIDIEKRYSAYEILKEFLCCRNKLGSLPDNAGYKLAIALGKTPFVEGKGAFQWD